MGALWKVLPHWLPALLLASEALYPVDTTVAQQGRPLLSKRHFMKLTEFQQYASKLSKRRNSSDSTNLTRCNPCPDAAQGPQEPNLGVIWGPCIGGGFALGVCLAAIFYVLRQRRIQQRSSEQQPVDPESQVHVSAPAPASQQMNGVPLPPAAAPPKLEPVQVAAPPTGARFPTRREVLQSQARLKASAPHPQDIVHAHPAVSGPCEETQPHDAAGARIISHEVIGGVVRSGAGSSRGGTAPRDNEAGSEMMRSVDLDIDVGEASPYILYLNSPKTVSSLRVPLQPPRTWEDTDMDDASVPVQSSRQDLTSARDYRGRMLLGEAAGADALASIDARDLVLDQSPLAKGSNKTVYRALWTPKGQKGTRVAVVTMRFRGVLVEHVAAMGAHAHLCKLFGTTSTSHEGDLCVVMEFAEMGSLADVLQDFAESGSTRPSVGVLLVLAEQICNAMQFLSLHNVVHGNLAARNCLVFAFHPKKPRKSLVKVTDYWLNLDVDTGSRAPGVIRGEANSTVGRSMRWLAPESIRYRTFSVKSDVYAFGNTLFELFSLGEIPFSCVQNEGEVAQRILDGVLPGRPKECPDDVYDVMSSCWNRSAQRPSFSELSIRLQDARIPRKRDRDSGAGAHLGQPETHKHTRERSSAQDDSRRTTAVWFFPTQGSDAHLGELNMEEQDEQEHTQTHQHTPAQQHTQSQDSDVHSEQTNTKQPGAHQRTPTHQRTSTHQHTQPQSSDARIPEQNTKQPDTYKHTPTHQRTQSRDRGPPAEEQDDELEGTVARLLYS